jgi:glucose/mannose-6-phosphate isomerase
MDKLDNQNTLTQLDPSGSFDTASNEWQQLAVLCQLENAHDTGNKTITNLVLMGMGGSGLATDLVIDLLDLKIPAQSVKDYTLPAYVGRDSLVIINSFSGNTEEALSVLQESARRRAQTVIITKGGALLGLAKTHEVPHVVLEWAHQPRMGIFLHMRALMTVLERYKVIDDTPLADMAGLAPWLQDTSREWEKSVPTKQNLAKQLALKCVGKTPLIYTAASRGSLAYKWKISFNENAKNVAYCNVFPEFNHNDFQGWTSHPVQKPFAILTLRSANDHPQIAKRFDLTDKLLSGMRPASIDVTLQGETLMAQLLYGCVLADFVTCYTAILNGVNPDSVDLIERFKKELK